MPTSLSSFGHFVPSRFLPKYISISKYEFLILEDPKIGLPGATTKQLSMEIDLMVHLERKNDKVFNGILK